jgi:transposase
LSKTKVTNQSGLSAVPDPEVSDRPRRRRFSAKYKLGVLRELDSCTAVGSVGAVLRREGLYSSHISVWRRQRANGELQGLAPKKVGRPPKKRNPLESEVVRLERKTARLQEELRKARLIIDVQKKLAAILGNPIPETSESDD